MVCIELIVLFLLPSIFAIAYFLTGETNVNHTISYFILLFHVIAICGCIVAIQHKEIKLDWDRKKCQMPYIIFSGFFDRTRGETFIDATKRNGKVCAHATHAYIEDNYKKAQEKMDHLNKAYSQFSVNMLQKMVTDVFEKAKNYAMNVIKPIVNTIFNIKTSIYGGFIAVKTVITMVLSIFIVVISVLFTLIELTKSVFLVLIAVIKNILILGFTIVIGLMFVPFVGKFLALAAMIIYIPILSTSVSTIAITKLIITVLNKVLDKGESNDCYKYITEYDCLGVGRCLWNKKSNQCSTPHLSYKDNDISDNPYLNSKDAEQIANIPENPI